MKMDLDQNASTVTTATHVVLNKPALRNRNRPGTQHPGLNSLSTHPLASHNVSSAMPSSMPVSMPASMPASMPSGTASAANMPLNTHLGFMDDKKDLLHMNLELSRQLNNVMTKQIKSLEQEIARLQDLLRENNTFNIVVFGPPTDLSVAAITNNSDEGIALCSRISEMFHRNQQNLLKRGITFAVIEDVPLNRMYDTPFLRTTN